MDINQNPPVATIVVDECTGRPLKILKFGALPEITAETLTDTDAKTLLHMSKSDVEQLNQIIANL